MSLRARLTLISTAVSVIVVVVAGILADVAARSTAGAQQDEVLAQLASQVAGRVAQYNPAVLRRAPVAAGIDVGTSSAEFFEVFDASGTEVYSSGLLGGTPPAVPADLLHRAADTSVPVTTSVSVSSVPLRVSILAVTHLGASSGGWVVAGESTAAIQAAFERLNRFLIVIAVSLLGLGAAVLWWLTRRSLRPLALAAATAEAVRRDRDLSRRLPPPPHRDEVGLLVGSFNGMVEELERTHDDLDSALASQRRFVADASHELRTPLTSIRSNVEFLRDHPDVSDDVRGATMADVEAESARMARMVDDLMMLARADAGQHLVLQSLDIGPVVTQVARQASVTHPDRRVTVHVDDVPPAQGNADAITQLCWILLNNAARHTAAGGAIDVTVSRSGRDVCIEVRDDGAGIPAQDLARIFERFYQADSSRGGRGAGLGLSIAAWIMGEHHGNIEAANQLPHGARFTARFHPQESRDSASQFPHSRG